MSYTHNLIDGRAWAGSAASRADLIAGVRAAAALFVPGRDVTISPEGVAAMAKIIRERANPAGRARKEVSEVLWFAQLLFGSVNYCYWYARADFYPAGAGAVLLEKLIHEELAGHDVLTPALMRGAVANLSATMALYRFPMLEQRVRHMREIVEAPEQTISFIRELRRETLSANEMLVRLVALYPGYAADPLLKRALLFFHMLHRMYGAFPREVISQLPIPTDYQVPKYLEHFGALRYSPALKDLIARAEMIPAGSRIEMEIRSATLVAADQIAAQTGLTTEEIDEFLWGNRKSVTTPFHLTVTTEY